MKKSQIFWNLIGVIAQIVLGIYCWQYLLIAHIFISLGVIILELDEIDVPLCFLLTYWTIIVLSYQLIKFIFHGIYTQTIHRFNTWLDGPQAEKNLDHDKLKNTGKKLLSYICVITTYLVGYVSISFFIKGSLHDWTTWCWVIPSCILLSPAMDFWTKFFDEKFNIKKD